MRHKYTAISVPTELIPIIDKTIEGRGFSSRAEFVKFAVRKQLELLGVDGVQ